jgi:hypothetical protein
VAHHADHPQHPRSDFQEDEDLKAGTSLKTIIEQTPEVHRRQPNR